LANARAERNRLFHSFYRKHNFRRNSDEGRAKMLEDLQRKHKVIIAAYTAVMRLSGIDLDNANVPMPTTHVKI
jgi:O-acetyl-ADP-ribose deacetylase (regulator of RNase III)